MNWGDGEMRGAGAGIGKTGRFTAGNGRNKNVPGAKWRGRSSRMRRACRIMYTLRRGNDKMRSVPGIAHEDYYHDVMVFSRMQVRCRKRELQVSVFL
jgi:hypothetical protein